MDVIRAFLKEWGALTIAGIALIVSIISLFKSSKTQRLQNDVNKLNTIINQDKIERIATEKEKSKLSCVKAQVVRQSDGKYKLKVWNSGNVNVYKVSAKIEEDSNIYISDSKMPFDELEPGKGFTENMRVILGSAPKFKITTLWEEAYGSTHEKTQMGEI